MTGITSPLGRGVEGRWRSLPAVSEPRRQAWSRPRTPIDFAHEHAVRLERANRKWAD